MRDYGRMGKSWTRAVVLIGALAVIAACSSKAGPAGSPDTPRPIDLSLQQRLYHDTRKIFLRASLNDDVLQLDLAVSFCLHQQRVVWIVHLLLIAYVVVF